MSVTSVLQGLIFFLSCFIIGFILGAYIGAQFFVPADAGLAGGAMVLGYGVMSAIAALVVAFVLQRQLSDKRYRLAIWITGLLALLGLAGLTYRFVTNRSAAEPHPPSLPEQTSQQRITAPAATLVSQNEQQGMGMGIASPRMEAAHTLYFYGQPTFDRLPDSRTAIDSLVFVQGAHYVDIGYAPPWFFPEYSKLDYDILLLRVVSLRQNGLEVIVNQQSGQTAWVDQEAVSWKEWPSFLLGVYAVKPLHQEDFPMRVKPLDHAGIYSQPPTEAWQVVAIKGDWLQIKDAGWIRWRNCEGLLVQYVLLS